MTDKKPPKLNPDQAKVYACLCDYERGNFCYVTFAFIAGETGLDRKAVRRACRALARKGLAKYGRGLWTEDGEPFGSGYAAIEVPA